VLRGQNQWGMRLQSAQCFDPALHDEFIAPFQRQGGIGRKDHAALPVDGNDVQAERRAKPALQNCLSIEMGAGWNEQPEEAFIHIVELLDMVLGPRDAFMLHMTDRQQASAYAGHEQGAREQ